MHMMILALALQCFFPLFDFSSGDYSGMSIVNPDTQARDFNVTITSADGVDSRSGTVTLAGNAERAMLLGEIIRSAPLPSVGSVRVDSSAAGCPYYFTSGNSDKLGGFEAAATPSRLVTLPHIAVNTGFVELQYVDTLVAIVNPNFTPLTVTAQLIRMDGAEIGRSDLQLPGAGSLTVRTSDIFRTVLPANASGGKVFNGYMLLNAPAGIVAWQRVETPSSRAVLRGRAFEEIQQTTFVSLPHVTTGAGYRSALNLINPGFFALDLVVAFQDDQGNDLAPQAALHLEPGQQARSSLDSFFAAVAVPRSSTFNGQIRIRERLGSPFRLIGDSEIARINPAEADEAALMYPLSDSGAISWLIPFADSFNGYFTGYAIVNPNELLAVQTDVTIEFVDLVGNVRTRQILSMSPRSHFAGLVPSGQLGGYVRISANLPVHVMATIGTADGRTLEQIPALRR